LSEAVRAELHDTGVEVSVVMPSVVKTELGGGLAEVRGVKQLEPEEVAEAIVKALQFPKFDVWVPASSAVIDKLFHPLPRRAREALGRFMKIDQVLAEPDRAERAAYEERAARSEPGLEPGSPVAEKEAKTEDAAPVAR
jgi:NAD(P)-dependent dehydrogenase (short-subunit alcohol dehydrogenase family)